MTINDDINALPRDQRIALLRLLHYNLNDRGWCGDYEVNYPNPDVTRAKQILYRQLETQGFEVLFGELRRKGLIQNLEEPLSLQSVVCSE